jgi:hypothetical protein
MIVDLRAAREKALARTCAKERHKLHAARFGWIAAQRLSIGKSKRLIVIGLVQWKAAAPGQMQFRN